MQTWPSLGTPRAIPSSNTITRSDVRYNATSNNTNTNSVLKSLARMRVFFSVYNDEMVVFSLWNAYFPTSSPIPSWRYQGDFSKVGKFRMFSTLMNTWSHVLTFDLCIDGCFRPCQHWFGGRGCWKYAENLPSKKRAFRLLTFTFDISSDMRSYINYVRSVVYPFIIIYSWIHFIMYEISRILSFIWIFFHFSWITYHVRFERRPRFLNVCPVS